MVNSLFIDFNAYFASVEEYLIPSIRGRAVAVTPVLSDSGCCIAANYAAKKYGVRTGTRVREARELCPEICIMEARPEAYVRIHHKLVEIVNSCMWVEQVCSIDEMRCPLTGKWREPARARALALQIKERLAEQTDGVIKASIGIAPNSYLAKVASEIQKPDGLTILLPEAIPTGLFSLKIGDLCGVGKRMEDRLAHCGVRTIEQLYELSSAQMGKIWGGVEGERMWLRLRGIEVTLPPTRRSTYGHSHVLPPELRRWPKARAVAMKLLQRAARRMREGGYYCRQLSVHVRCGNDREWANDAIFDETQSTQWLVERLAQLWDARPALPVPLAVSVNLSNLTACALHTPSLWRNGDEAHAYAVDKAMDALFSSYGVQTVFWGGALGAQNSAPTRIAFTQIPDFGPYDSVRTREQPMDTGGES